MPKHVASEIGYPNIRDAIRGLTLFSKELTEAYKDRRYVLHTLRSLSVMDGITEEMQREMRIDVEEWMKKGEGKRGARFDAYITFPKERINIEIQRAERGDEIPRSSFYVGKSLTDIEEGLEHIPMTKHLSIWICGFDPFPREGLPYYVFTSRYKTRDGIRGGEYSFEMGNGIEYVFVNGSYDWERAKVESPLTEAEVMLRDYINDMKQSSPRNMISEDARRVLTDFKEGGSLYDKIEESFRERYATYYAKAEEIGKKEGISIGEKRGKEEGISIGEKRGRNAERIAIARNLFSTGVDIDIISISTGFTKDEVISLCK